MFAVWLLVFCWWCVWLLLVVVLGIIVPACDFAAAWVVVIWFSVLVVLVFGLFVCFEFVFVGV